MNGISKSRVENYNSIISLLLDNKAIVSTVRALSYSTSKLCNIIDIINKQQRTLKSEQSRRVFRNSKCKDNLIASLVPFAAALYDYGNESGNSQLCMKYCRISQSYLLALSDNELLNKAISINISSEKYLTGLKTHGISYKDLQHLKCKIEDFKYTLSYSMDAAYFSTPSESSLDGLYLEADKLLNNMDSYVENLSMNYSGFYDKYLTVRKNDADSGRRFIHKYTA